MSTSTMSRSTRIRSRIVTPLLAAGLLAATGSALAPAAASAAPSASPATVDDQRRSDSGTHPDHRVVGPPGRAHRSGTAG